MDHTKPRKIEDIRQAPGWQSYLEWLGWKCEKTPKGISIFLRKEGPLVVTKIQRPRLLDETDLREIEDICRKNKALFIKIEPNVGQDTKVLRKHGYRKNHHPLLPPSTLVLDLGKPEEQLHEELSRSAKYSIRRAFREGAKVDFHKNPDDNLVEEFARMAKTSAKSKNFLNVSLEDAKQKVKIFKDRVYLVMVRNRKEECMGANLYLAHNNNVWFLHGGMSEVARHGKWGYALVWESIRYFKKQGFDFLDLEGLDDERFPTKTKQWGGFSHFKEKFGGTRITYPFPYMKVLNPILRMLEKIYGNLPF
jgi:lipid II:glycine glycyltransferase (peptidoglycan interpeptide bridge formation enzyme)